jgi:thiol-disulfide isomerase/thioredoxin
LHLQNGDQVPCTIASIDQGGVHFTTDFSDVSRVSPDELKAVEFNSATSNIITDFMDPRWQISLQQPNSVERTETQLALRGAATLSHPDLMKQGGLEFDLSWQPNLQVTLDTYLLTGANVRQSMQGHRFHISVTGSQIQIHSITNDGNVQSYMVQAKSAEKGKLKASFCFSSERGEMKLLVDGTLVCGIPMLDRNPAGTGIRMNFQPANIAQHVVQEVNAEGRVIRRVVRQVANPLNANAAPMLTISNMRASEGSGLLRGAQLGEKDRTQFLTVPRMRRHNPPQHALIARNGDLVRGELLSLGPKDAKFRVGLEDVVISRERLAGIVWLELESETERQPVDTGTMQAVFRNGSILHVSLDQVDDGKAVGKHPVLGNCRLSLDEIYELRTGKPSQAAAVVAYSEWTLINAKEPVIPGGDGSGDAFGTFSPLVGKQAEDFTLDLLDGKNFRLSEHKNKVVVLDFWATWCVSCVQAFPQLIGATSKHPDDVIYIAVNQQESAATIREFLETHEWTAEVALDRDGNIGRMYQVDGIPQTVVVGRGGKIEKVGLGVSPNLEDELGRALAELVASKEAAEELEADR